MAIVRVRLARSARRDGRALSRGIAWWLKNQVGIKADRAVYNLRCQPAWSENELLHKLRDAAQITTHRHPRGHLLAAAFERWRHWQDQHGAARTYAFQVS